jgi:hypothetical protein
VWVTDNMQVQEGIIQWNVIFISPYQDWEVKAVVSFLERYSFKLRQGVEDRNWIFFLYIYISNVVYIKKSRGAQL